MKIIHRNGKIVALATDEYNGQDSFILAPEDFTADDMDKYDVVDGELVISKDFIKRQIAELDFRRIRPLAEGDTVFLADLNAQIVALRAQL
jgi:hypothetical protein